MKLSSFFNSGNKSRIVALCVVFVLLITAVFSGIMYAKYIKEQAFSGNVTISAELAKGFSLYETKCEMNSTGQYVPTAETTDANSYLVLPGVEIPKDPTIKITGKTKIPGYLYIEVVDGLDHAKVNYTLESNWVELTGATPHTAGAKVYVYCQAGNTPYLFDGTTDAFVINIIKDKKLTVTTHRNVGGNADLTFHAYMKQVSGSSSATDVYNNVG